jgi:hypothetical protein
MTRLYGNWSNLPSLEPHYCAHVSAMTTEGLRSKSAIAAELAIRDQESARLQADVARLREALSNLHEAACGVHPQWDSAREKQYVYDFHAAINAAQVALAATVATEQPLRCTCVGIPPERDERCPEHGSARPGQGRCEPAAPLCRTCGKGPREGRHATDLGEGHDYEPGDGK